MGQFKVYRAAVPCNITQEKVTLDDKGGSANKKKNVPCSFYDSNFKSVLFSGRHSLGP